MIERSFDPSFSLALAAKDAGLVAEAAAAAGLDLPLPRAIRDADGEGDRGRARGRGHGRDVLASCPSAPNVATARAAAATDPPARWTTSACWTRSRAVPRDRFVPPEMARRGVGQRAAADRRAGRRSPSRSWWRGCASCCELTRLRARARRRHRLGLPRRGAGAAVRARVEHRAPRRAVRAGGARTSRAAGVENVTLRGRRRRARAAGRGAVRRDQRRRRGAAAVPAALEAQLAPGRPPGRAGRGRRPAAVPRAPHGRRAASARALERVRFVPLVT